MIIVDAERIADAGQSADDAGRKAAACRCLEGGIFFSHISLIDIK
jgi:hypothetical protein